MKMIKCPTCNFLYPITEEEQICPACQYKVPKESGIIRFILSESNEFFFPVDAFSVLYKYETNHFWFRSRNIIIESIINRFIPSNHSSDKRFCEVGCGTGFVSKNLTQKGYRISCCDLFLEGLLFAQKRNSGELYFQCNLLNFPFFEEFDVILACDVLEHVDDDNKALSRIYDALKPGGFCLITVPASHALWSETDVYAGHKRRYERDEIIQKVKYSNFLPIKTSYFMTIPFPILGLKRIISKPKKENLNKIDDRLKMSNELHLPYLLNELLYLSLLPEQLIIPHMNLPFGSSLICIAQK